MLDLMTVKFLSSYSTRPLQMFGGVGISMGSLGVLVCAWLVYVKIFHHEGIGDRPLLLLGVSMILGGINLVMTGLLAEMLSRTYHESQDKAIYAIREIRESALQRDGERT